MAGFAEDIAGFAGIETTGFTGIDSDSTGEDSTGETVADLGFGVGFAGFETDFPPFTDFSAGE